MAARVSLFLAVLVAALLMAEGALSLLGAQSLRQLGASAPLIVPTVHLGTDAERAAAAHGAEGSLMGHADPLVGVMMRARAESPTHHAVASIGPGGVRGRPEPMPKERAQHIVVLGDSVAFGYGVNDDETLAHQLELILARVRGPDALPVVASTVAVPGWNQANSAHFLIDHLPTLKPDIVVLLPVNNDLTDTFGATEGGFRALMPDVAQLDPYLSVHDEPLIGFITRSVEAAQAKGLVFGLGADAAGPKALTADLSAESQRRYDGAAHSIALLQGVLQNAGVRLLLAYHEEDAYSWTLQSRLLAANIDVPVVPLFSTIPRAYRLPDDSHPSAAGQGFMARWIADDLVRRGWVDGGAGRAQPPLPAGALSHRAVELSSVEVGEKANEAARTAERLLQSQIDLTNGRGVYQIYGGLNQDGSMGSAFSAVLAPGTRVEVTLAPEPKLAQLYPLRVTVSLDGALVGELVVPGSGQCSGVFSRPEGADVTRPVECKLSPELWAVSQAFGRSQVASCRLLSVESQPD